VEVGRIAAQGNDEVAEGVESADAVRGAGPKKTMSEARTSSTLDSSPPFRRSK
jgi:hypothetical protein